MKQYIFFLLIITIFSCDTKTISVYENQTAVSESSNLDKNSRRGTSVEPNSDKLGTAKLRDEHKIDYIKVNDFFKLRNSVQGEFSKIKYEYPVLTIKVSDFYKYTVSGDLDGEILFLLELKNNKLNSKIVGTRSFGGKSKIMVDYDPTKYKIDTNSYKVYHNNMVKKKILPYTNYNKSTHISFSKKSIKATLDNFLANKKLDINNDLLFYYGYSINDKNKAHPSILFSSKKDLEFRSVNIYDDSKFAFGDRMGTCCPPQN